MIRVKETQTCYVLCHYRQTSWRLSGEEKQLNNDDDPVCLVCGDALTLMKKLISNIIFFRFHHTTFRQSCVMSEIVAAAAQRQEPDTVKLFQSVTGAYYS